MPNEYLDVNLRGAANVLEVFGGYFASVGGGAMVTLASLYSIVGSDPRLYALSVEKNDKSPLYEATKAGVVGLVRHFAVRLGPRNVRINALSPGGVANDQPLWFTEGYSARVPLGRLATTRDVAEAVEFLISERSAYLTGQNLVLDGGYSAW